MNPTERRVKLSFDHRVIEPEILDDSPPDIARKNLADLIRINRFFGGHAVIAQLFEQSVRRDEAFSVLDIGAASGDTARLVQSLYPKARVVSLDLHPVNFENAPYPKVLADAFRLPFAARSFDFVMSSLFLHHFTNERVLQFLRSANAIARRGVLMADLERHVVPYLFLPASRLLFGWGSVTVHDGKISVRAAFRADELKQIARAAGLSNIIVKVHRPAFRISLSAVKAAKEAGEHPEVDTHRQRGAAVAQG
jgi:2-polyprenyl-3-methyl-5-hydroxy-6-metoxy-1,4-benzoquinol methylase